MKLEEQIKKRQEHAKVQRIEKYTRTQWNEKDRKKTTTAEENYIITGRKKQK